MGRNMHTRLTILMISAVMVTGVLFGGTAEAQTTGAQTTGDYTTVWNGIYTPDQALRGQDAFELHCLRCHETDIDAANPDARFRGHMFMERWREYDLVSLYDFIRLTMPRRDPGSLSDATYVDIVAHVMMVNAFPPGPRELDTEVLQSIQIEGKDGPMPLPSGALVQLVGCLNQDVNGAWIINKASEPARTNSSNRSTEEEMTAAGSKALGNQRFRLQNIEFLGQEFEPESKVGYKMQTKGYLIRQPNRERIDITAMEWTGASCR